MKSLNSKILTRYLHIVTLYLVLASQLRATLDLVDRFLIHVGDLGKYSHVGRRLWRG